jgi:hypothetical protein
MAVITTKSHVAVEREERAAKATASPVWNRNPDDDE